MSSANCLLCINCGKPVIAAQDKFPYCDKCQRVANRLIAGFNRLSEEEQDKLLLELEEEVNE